MNIETKRTTFDCRCAQFAAVEDAGTTVVFELTENGERAEFRLPGVRHSVDLLQAVAAIQADAGTEGYEEGIASGSTKRSRTRSRAGRP